MANPIVSVIIPAYNQADFVGQTIQSVLDQTFTDFELIVVNDASPDHTAQVVRQFDDPRLRYIEHEHNRGLPATRNTGMRVAQGELLALLDSDDLFHPEKLQLHLDFLDKHPEIGATYNARFELNYSSITIRELVQTPATVSLSQLVLGFPFTPSDLVLRRDWAFRVNLFNEELLFGSEDLDFPIRLALAGCNFADVGRALNYRRHHSFRIRKHLDRRLAEYLEVLRKSFADPRCPTEIQDHDYEAFRNRYLEVASYAIYQGETTLGQQCLREAVRLDPTIIKGHPCPLIIDFVFSSIADDNQDHCALIQTVLAQLPAEMEWLSEQYGWAVARGYLLKGTRAIIWGRLEDGRAHFARAAELEVEIDEIYLRNVTHQLLGYELEFGQEAADYSWQNLAACLKQLGGWSLVRRQQGNLFANRAYQNFKAGESEAARRNMVQALTNDPRYLTNRGVWSVLLRSIGSTARGD